MVRSDDSSPFLPSIAHVLTDVAALLGLTLALVDRARKLFDTNNILLKQQNDQSQAFSDLAHQILSPHRTALHQLERGLINLRSVADDKIRSKIQGPLWVARGQIRRATRVGRSAGLFGELHLNGHIAQKHASTAPLTIKQLQDAIHRLVGDEQSLRDPAKFLDFQERIALLPEIYRNDIRIDVTQFEQVLSALLENAAKYSLSNSTITVSAGRDSDDLFYLEVENFGYEIAADEVESLKKRGARGRAAGVRVANGHGIGLWIANAIMISLGGKLDIEAGNFRAKPHQFRIIFPTSSKRT